MDDIRRKLELIDRQLTGPNFHERVISTCPLVFVAVGLIAGIMIQEKSGVSVYIWLILLAAPAVATVFFFVMPHFSSAGRYVTAYLALACFICLGAIRLTSYSQPEPNDIRNLVADEPKLASIRVSLTSANTPTGNLHDSNPAIRPAVFILRLLKSKALPAGRK